MIAGLLAPNGKPSNLTPEQYLLVRTDAFKEFFGDWEKLALTKVYDSAIDEVSLKRLEDAVSKVVDSNGEPLVLYHGTDVNFNVYDLTKIGEGSDLLGKGIYLTEKKDVANFYANLVGQKRYIIKYEKGIFDSENPIYEKDADKKAEKHKVIYQFFVNAKNVVDINKIEVDNNIKQILIKSISDLFEEKSEEYVNDKIDFANKNYKDIRNYRGMLLYLIYLFPDSKEEVLQYIKNKYDCIIFEPSTEFETDLGEYKNYVVFNPEQIKLADGSNTTFDANNDDIRFKDGGNVLLAPNGKPSNLTPEQYKLVRTPEFKAWFGDWEKGVFTDYQKLVEYKHKIGTGASNIVSIDYICQEIDLDKAKTIKSFHKKAFEFLYSEYESANKNNYQIDFKNFIIKFLIMYKPVFDLVNQLTSNEDIEITKKTLKEFHEKNFQEWVDYKNKNISKVVDSNGEPKVVGRKDYERIYDYGEEYFTFFAEKKDVKYFNEFGEYDTYTFLNIKNPLIIDFGDSWANIPYDVLLKVFSKNDLIKMINNENNENFKSWEEYIATLEDGYEPYLFSTDSVASYVKKQKINDGVIIYEIGETANASVITNDFIVFNSNQIKLADGTNNTFDSNNPDIRFNDGGVIVNPTEIECHNCHWNWKVKDGGDDLFICHKCNYDNSKFYEFKGLEGERILDTISYKKGGRTISQTPAPKKDQIKGSDKNKEGSAKDLTSAKKIKFSDDVLEKIQNSVDKHNKKHSEKKITIDSAKAVVRRGMGAYSSTHRPTISGGNENSRVAWGLARLNAFLFKIVNGKSKSGKYSQDNDLIQELGYKVEKFADGGDIQSYEQAMGISEFDEGGEAKPKKVYVSIRLQSKRENIINEDRIWRGDRFTTFEEKTFEELKNHQLIGIRGVSLSPNNIGDWFSYKDCLVVMNYDEFFKLNDATKVKYDDPYQLMENDLKIFNRLYGNSEYTDEREKKITRRENLKKIIEKLPFYFDKAKYEYYYDDAQKRDELTRYYMAIGNFGYKFVDWIIKNDYIINNPNELVEKIIQFTHLPDSESGIDYYYRYGLEKYVLTAEDIFPIVMKGLIKAGSTYTDEAEVIINNKLLNLPNNTQLFFKKEDFEKSDLQDLIDKYELNQTYRVYSIKSQYIKEYQDKLLAKRTKRDVSKWELGKEQLEIKKELVLNDLQKLFFDKSLNKINKILDEKYPLKYYLDWEGDKTKYYRWNEVIEVQFLLNKFFEITLRDWKSVFRTKRANEIYSMSFYALYNSIDYFFRQFIEQNRDYLETINKYHNENGDTLWLYDIERAVLDMVSTYEEENGISDNQLAKKYFQMIGGELTSYYKQDEIVMPSIYKDGGEADEPTHFWGTEAGGVLVYCSTTQRYLILLRSEWVLEPNTWGIISGKLDDDETNIEDAVLRESEEEIGYKLSNLIPTYIFEKPNFKFHNFVSIVNEEFVPELNWENTDYKWVKLNEMPDNLHFGLKLLIEKEDITKLVKKHKMENEILIVDMNMYHYDTSVNFMNQEIPLKLNAPKNEVRFIEFAIENNIDFEQWGDAGEDDTSWGYTFEIPLFKYIEYLKTEKFYTGGELKKGIKTEMEHKDTIKKIKTGDYNIKKSAELIAKDHLKENDKYYTHLIEMESKFEDGGKVNSIKSKKGDIKISLDENWYSDDTDVELVPVSELIKFREFDRKVKPKYNQDNSRDNINHLKYMFQRDGVKEPIIIEYSPESNSVLVIEGNHRINSAIDLGMEYLPARVVLKKYGNFNANQLKNTISVSGVTADEYGYIPSNLKPSKVGIQGATPIVYGDGGIIEGRLHSECGDDGCGRKFQVGEGGHIIEAERDEAVIVADAFNDNEKYTIKGTPSEVASALNVMGGGKNFDKGAEIVKNGQQLNMPELKKQAVDTDVDDVIDGGSIIINRRTMADEKQYEVTGTPKQIASAINSLDGNGVVIENGGTIKKG